MYYEEDEDMPKPKPMSLVFLALIVVAFFLGQLLGKSRAHHEPVEVDLTAVAKRDSIIAEKDSVIRFMGNQISERDSVIIYMVGRESNQRATIFSHLQDNFVGAPDSTKEALINEALNAIQ